MDLLRHRTAVRVPTKGCTQGRTEYTSTASDLCNEERDGRAIVGSAKFWSNRLACTDPPLEISQTRIPEIPDQTDFLERWWEFHQGHRVIKRPGGSEQRIAVIGEPFKEVSPGFLPRTLDQLRAGVQNDARRPENRLRRRRLSSEEEQPQQPQQSLEDALDDILNGLSDDETPSAETQHVPQTSETLEHEAPEQTRPVTSRADQLQRARERFARVFGSREEVQQDDYESPLTQMYGRAYDRYRQAEERRAEGTTSAPALDGLSVQERRDIEEQLLWGVMRDSQAMSESLEREGDVWSYAPARSSVAEVPSSIEAANIDSIQRFYESLVETTTQAGLFFYDWTARLKQDALFPLKELRSQQSSQRTPGSNAKHHARHGRCTQRPHNHNVPLNPTPPPTTQPTTTTGFSDIRTNIQQITSELQRLRLASEALSSARHSMHARTHHLSEPLLPSLDNQPDRPAAPKTDEEMTKTLACQICYQQLADIAVLPCGHMVMCQWCADVVVPVRHSHLPVRPTKCPMCRKQVKQRFKIHMGS
ncbi:hypothetical protein N0V83_009871 [Neocucurbitaria cava]|uniref:RING-type domain-containing protein n=1 Tax=Neocucurbitaria cava TaxID=798079 RepID=A0A9W8Y046_9PLEO|nr:hypothetical protein N0V83_009871 [Neocucurbitaria cava]